jgi:hypothetical protein
MGLELRFLAANGNFGRRRSRHELRSAHVLGRRVHSIVMSHFSPPIAQQISRYIEERI